MRVHLAADHAGYELKGLLAAHLRNLGYDVVDHGAHAYEELDDYPAFCFAAGQAVVAEPGSLGIVLGGSGNGEQIAANKVPGVRAALAWSPEIARLARAHNDANIAGLGGRVHPTEVAFEIVRTFLETPFSGDERHARRVAQVAEYETNR